jgi:hypothetical protein
MPEQCLHSILISFRYFPPTATKRAALLSLVSTLLLALFALALPSRHAAACRCLVLPCRAACWVAARSLHACSTACRPSCPSHQGCCCHRPRLSSAACSWSWAVPELHVHPRARARYRGRTSHPCARPSRTELVRHDPRAASPAPPSSSRCHPSASLMPRRAIVQSTAPRALSSSPQERLHADGLP